MLSILMPVYNGIEFIEESVRSVMNQTYTGWELIIAVNGHPENSEVYQAAKKYENQQTRVYDLFTLKGKSNTLNHSLQYCNSNKVCLLDVDDIWHPEKLQKQLDYLYKYDVVGTYCNYFGNKNGSPELVVGQISSVMFRLFNPIINSSACFNKSDAYWDQELDGVEDYDMWLRLMTQGKTFYNLNEVLVSHRLYDSSFFNTSSKQASNRTIVLKKYFGQ